MVINQLIWAVNGTLEINWQKFVGSLLGNGWFTSFGLRFLTKILTTISFISINWAGEPLTSFKKMIEFINTTTTKTGLIVTGVLITKEYKTKIKYSDAQMDEIKIKRMKILPEWNYRILPN